MEYMNGGDFLGLLIRYDKLTESAARFYIAEMILAVEEAHKLKWIHRDVKPDNFLISASGHLKISDFGLAFDGHWSHDQKFFRNTRTSLMQKLGIEVSGDLQDMCEDAEESTARKFTNMITPNRKGSKHGRHSRHFTCSDSEECPIAYKNRTRNRVLARSVVGTSQYMAPEVIRGEEYDGRCA